MVSHFNSMRATVLLSLGSACERDGCYRRTRWISGRVVLCGAVASWECLYFSLCNFLTQGILARNVFIHTQVEPEQVDILMVPEVLSKGGKTLMLIVQIVMQCNSHSCYLKALEIWKAVKYLVVHAPAQTCTSMTSRAICVHLEISPAIPCRSFFVFFSVESSQLQRCHDVHDSCGKPDQENFVLGCRRRDFLYFSRSEKFCVRQTCYFLQHLP